MTLSTAHPQMSCRYLKPIHGTPVEKSYPPWNLYGRTVEVTWTLWKSVALPWMVCRSSTAVRQIPYGKTVEMPWTLCKSAVQPRMVSRCSVAGLQNLYGRTVEVPWTLWKSWRIDRRSIDRPRRVAFSTGVPWMGCGYLQLICGWAVDRVLFYVGKSYFILDLVYKYVIS